MYCTLRCFEVPRSAVRCGALLCNALPLAGKPTGMLPKKHTALLSLAFHCVAMSRNALPGVAIIAILGDKTLVLLPMPSQTFTLHQNPRGGLIQHATIYYR